jgi:formylglycine-generating enzyme required for sulfatase activity
MKLARIPAGEFVMGDATGQLDERPLVRHKIARDFWMGVLEVTNEQFRRFEAKHNSGRFTKRFVGTDGPGLSLDGAKLPAVRVSWKQADAFCKWLSKETSLEYACRAGSAEALSYGVIDADFSAHANLADKALGGRPNATGGLQSNITSVSSKKIKGILLSAVYGGNIICDPNFDDKAVATSPAGRYKANAWGLFDMHGNAAEWTQTTYRSYSTKADDRNAPAAAIRKVLRGGSWVDRPKRCRSGFRLAYPTWQRVHNAGFRVVCKVER